MSNTTGNGVFDVKSKACDILLKYREVKNSGNKTKDITGLDKIYIAQPTQIRDNRKRTPNIPQSFLEEFEEYELSEEDEELIDTNENKDKEKDKITKNQNIDSKKLKDIISNKKDEKEDKFEEDEEEEEEEEEYKPNIKIEYVSREDEPAPFDKD